MAYRPCPDCSTGWRYSDELPGWHRHPSKVTLVKCPTCGGYGRIVVPDEPEAALREPDWTEPRSLELPPTLLRHDY